MAFASRTAAIRCQQFAERALQGLTVTDSSVEAVHSTVVALGVGDVHAVSVPAVHAGLLKTYWQHTGEIISSR